MNDNLRPNKPWYYWWKNMKGENHIAYFTLNQRGILYDAVSDCDVTEFELGGNFKCWLGPVEPPSRKEFLQMGYWRNDSPVSLGQARVIALGEQIVYFETALYGIMCVPQTVICCNGVMRVTPVWEELFVKAWFAEIMNKTLFEKNKDGEVK